MSAELTSAPYLRRYLARIRLRLALWTLAVMAPVVIALSLWGYSNASQALQEASDQQLLDRTTLIAYDVNVVHHRIDTSPYLKDTRLSHTTWLVFIADRNANVISGPPQHALPWIVPDRQSFSKALSIGDIAGPTSLHLRGRTYRVATVPIYDGDKVAGAVQAAKPTRPQDDQINRLQFIQIAGTLLALLVAAGGGIFLAYRASSPIQQAAIQQQQFTDDAAHDLRTPIAIIRGQAEIALHARPPDSTALLGALSHIRDEAEHLGSLVDDMLTLARADGHGITLKIDRFPLDELGLAISRRAEPVAASRGIQLSAVGGSSVEVEGDFHQLEGTILNLLDNALKYTKDGGRVTVEVGQDATRGWIEIADTGDGIAADQLALVGRRFYRPDERAEPEDRRRGSGLGLAIARRVAEQHGGGLEIHSTEGEGTRVRVVLPRSHDSYTNGNES